MKQIVLYPTLSDGSVPDFIYSKIDGIAGIYSLNKKSIGISVNDPVGNFEIILSEDDLFQYLKKIDFFYENCLDCISGAYGPDAPKAAANWLWKRLEYLNTLP